MYPACTAVFVAISRCSRVRALFMYSCMQMSVTWYAGACCYTAQLLTNYNPSGPPRIHISVTRGRHVGPVTKTRSSQQAFLSLA